MADSPIPPPVPNAAPSKMSGMAIASLVLGILGLCSGGLLALFGLIFGIIAIVNINKSRGELAGHGIALAGIIVSAVFLLIMPIAVLTSMLLPALAAAKERAQSIQSITNEKQLALAVRVYAGDHDNHLPPAATWCDAINSIVGHPSTFVRAGSAPGTRCSYAFNAALGDMDSSKVDPRTVMIFESDSGWNASGGADIMRTSGYGSRAHYAVVAYVDGSVQQIPQSQLGELRWNP